jgi:hypothetical protein
MPPRVLGDKAAGVVRSLAKRSWVGETFRLPFCVEAVTEREEVAVVVPSTLFAATVSTLKYVKKSQAGMPSGSDPATEPGPLKPRALLMMTLPSE